MNDIYYDEIARGYEELHRDEQEKKILIIKKYLRVNETDLLLDVGCGTGITSNFPCAVVGLDPSAKLLKRFTAPLAKSVKTICAPAEKMPLENESFDVVVSITALQNFDDAEQGLKEMCRVGKKEARYAISFLKKSTKKEQLVTLIKKYFVVEKKIEEDKDILFFCGKKPKKSKESGWEMSDKDAEEMKNTLRNGWKKWNSSAFHTPLLKHH